MFDLGKIGAAVTLDDSDFKRVLGSLEQSTTAVFKKIAGIAAGLFGLKSIADYAKNAVKAYIVQENAVDGLSRALQAVGQGDYKKKLQDVAKGLQDVTAYGDEATMATMTLGLNMGISADRMEEATKAAMGLAAKYNNLDVNSAMRLIARAQAGNTSMLKRYAITLDESKSKQEQFNELLKKGEQAFPLAQARTFGQKLQQLWNAWGDLSEQVGEFIITLFDLDEAQADSMNLIKQATDWMKDNLDELAYEIKFVYRYFEAGVKSAYAIFEPIILYVWRSVKDLATNVVALGQWAFDNADKIWENLPDILSGVLDDIINYFRNWAKFYLDIVVNLAKAIGTVIADTVKGVWDKLKKTAEMIINIGENLAKAIKGVFTGEGIGGFKEMWESVKNDFDNVVSGGFNIDTSGFKKTWEDMKTDAIKVAGEIGKYTEEALNNAGVAELPEMQKTAFISDVVDMYKQLPERTGEFFREMEQKQAKDLDKYYKTLQRKRAKDRKGDGKYVDPVEDTKNNVSGSFSAAVLSGMIGASAPEKETAKNTRQMVEQQRETNRELKKSKKETYT